MCNACPQKVPASTRIRPPTPVRRRVACRSQMASTRQHNKSLVSGIIGALRLCSDKRQVGLHREKIDTEKESRKGTPTRHQNKGWSTTLKGRTRLPNAEGSTSDHGAVQARRSTTQ